MAQGINVLTLVLAGAALVVLFAVGGGLWLYSVFAEVSESMKQGAAFGLERTDAECLDESIERLRSCRALACKLANGNFFWGCADVTQRSDAFCDGVPDTLDLADSQRWRDEKCSAARLRDDFCPILFSSVQVYCEAG